MKEQVILYQELTTNSWPPKSIISLNGWKIRISEGVTMRANSVSPLNYEGDDLKKDVEYVESIYKRNNLPIIFQLADYYQPYNLYEFLIDRGYKEVDETIVMIAQINEIIDIPINSNFNFIASETNLERWIDDFKTIRPEGVTRIEGMKKIIQRLKEPKPCFFSAEEEEPVAVGLTVTEREFMVIYNMYTHQKYRRQGIAKSLLAKMIEKGKKDKVKNIYLQVEADNYGAIKLYSKIGMKECYRYRYLIRKED
jgi:ribosomal protein S18 acetylase RimI-like enzyme